MLVDGERHQVMTKQMTAVNMLKVWLLKVDGELSRCTRSDIGKTVIAIEPGQFNS